MASIKNWIQAARLRTLPLATSGILAGAALAWNSDIFSWHTSLLALLTALLLQILSNFANDYGDFTKGTDNEDRVGPERAMQSGAINAAQMKRAMGVTALLSLVSGIALILSALPMLTSVAWVVFGIIGLLAIGAAVLYTVGKRAYGYFGLGDVMVFIFFGLASVVGAFYLNTGTMPWEAWAIGFGIGCLSTGVLNLNNMRDIDNDIASGKKTLASRLGFEKAKIYHTVLIVLGAYSIMITALFLKVDIMFLIVLVFPSGKLYNDMIQVRRTTDKALLDPYLKKLSLGTFLLTVFLVFSIIFSK